MKKKIIFGLLCLVAIVTLTGCSKKTVLTTEDFISKSEANGYQTVDVKTQFSEYDELKSATLAMNDNYQVEFYVLDNETNAKSMFDTNKATFEDYKTSSNAESSVSLKNYSTYSLTTGGYYMYLSRVDNTLIYLRVEAKYKDEVKSFVKALGY